MNLERFYADWQQWFAQPYGQKEKLLRSPGNGGYYPPASESPGFTGNPDPKEYFHVRTEHLRKLWPDSPTEAVFNECWEKATDWLLDHGLDELTLMGWSEHCVLRIIHYPAHPTGLVGEAHRDFDLLTVSVEGTAPGLEVKEKEFSCTGHRNPCKCAPWVPQETGIQVGEMLEIYAGVNDRHPYPIPATTHRVRTAPNTERFKAVFFYLPPMDFELRPGFTAQDYLTGPNGVLKRAGTAI